MVNIIVKDQDGGYDWKLTAKKFGIVVGMAAGLAALTTLVDSLTGLQFPVDSVETIIVGVCLATAKALENYLKNKNNMPQ